MIVNLRCPLGESNHEQHLSLWLVRATLSLVLCASAISCSTTTEQVATVAVERTYATVSPISKTAEIAENGPAMPQQTASGWFATIDDDFALARQLVEQELQIDLGSIQLRLVDNPPINEEVAIETMRLIREQFGKSTFSDQFLQQIMHPLAGTYAALYSARLKSVMISRSMLESYANSIATDAADSTMRAALLTLLIHELVHAADDQRYRIHDNRALNFRASFAQSATFEGHAQWVTRNICKKAGCSIGLNTLDNFMFSTDEKKKHLAQPVEAISRSVLEYSYVEGERFIDGLAQRENGSQLIDDLLSSPPLDPIQILAPDTYPDAARETRNQRLIQASRNAEHVLTKFPWKGVETSPLKGVDLRADPTRRQAAVDGFTLLIKAMISMQFYDQQAPGKMPVESTVLQADSIDTARLFANMLHANTQQSGARVSEESLNVEFTDESSTQTLPVRIYRTALDGDIRYRTAIAVSGNHVVQVSASAQEQQLLDDYAIRVLIDLDQS